MCFSEAYFTAKKSRAEPGASAEESSFPKLCLIETSCASEPCPTEPSVTTKLCVLEPSTAKEFCSIELSIP
jgi:hypothetical protein